MLGYVSDAALAELYRRCAVFCYPSLGEGFGLPVLEAMAAGRGGAHLRGLLAAGGRRRRGRVRRSHCTREHRAPGCARARRGARRAELAARARARAEFSWERFASVTLETLDRAAAGRRAVLRGAGRLSPMPARASFLTSTRTTRTTSADGVLHGLRTLLRAPTWSTSRRRSSCTTAIRPSVVARALRTRLHASTACSRTSPVDRDRALERARAGEFDLVVFARHLGHLRALRRARAARCEGIPRWRCSTERIARSPIRTRGCGGASPGGGAAARAQARAVLQARAHAADRLVPLLPAATARARRTAPSIRAMREISFSIPAEKILTSAPDERKAPAVRQPRRRPGSGAAQLGVETAYAFDDEADYYADLQQSRFGITVKRAGWDCLRHYEQAANGCVPLLSRSGPQARRAARRTGWTTPTASPTATSMS